MSNFITENWGLIATVTFVLFVIYLPRMPQLGLLEVPIGIAALVNFIFVFVYWVAKADCWFAPSLKYCR